MNPEPIAKAVAAVTAPLVTLLGVASRKRRLRHEIHENLALVKELRNDEILWSRTPAGAWLQGKIALDVARLAGQPLGTQKKPIPLGSLVLAALLRLIFGLWTAFIVREGFVWYSVFPGTVALMMVISIFGMTLNRELPPDSALPAGATPLAPTNAQNEFVTTVALLASGANDQEFTSTGQVTVTFQFARSLAAGRYEEGWALADDVWRLCRIQGWIWNNRSEFGEDLADCEQLATSLVDLQSPQGIWDSFVRSEASMFMETWGPLNIQDYGVSNRRRRLSENLELVVLAPLGKTGGYLVHQPTQVSALTFVVRRSGDSWRIVNHAGTAPPVPGWPPTWWVTDDPAVTALPDS